MPAPVYVSKQSSSVILPALYTATGDHGNRNEDTIDLTSPVGGVFVPQKSADY